MPHPHRGVRARFVNEDETADGALRLTDPADNRTRRIGGRFSKAPRGFTLTGPFPQRSR